MGDTRKARGFFLGTLSRGYPPTGAERPQTKGLHSVWGCNIHPVLRNGDLHHEHTCSTHAAYMQHTCSIPPTAFAAGGVSPSPRRERRRVSFPRPLGRGRREGEGTLAHNTNPRPPLGGRGRSRAAAARGGGQRARAGRAAGNARRT